MKATWLCGFVCGWACVPLLCEQCLAVPPALALVHDGQAQCAILTSSAAGKAEQLAAEQLAAYLKRIGGAAVPVQAAAGGEVSAAPAGIVICRQGAPEAANLTPPLPKLPPEGFTIAVRGQRVYLVGADDRGVLYATYAFLERLGCRWLAPALGFYKGTNEFVPAQPTISFAPDRDVVEQPVLAFRKLYVEEGHSHTTENLLQMIDWMPKLRFNTLVVPIDYSGRGRVEWDNWREALTPELKRRGIIIEVGGHGYQNFLNAEMDGGRLFREHADWFGLDEGGKRTTSQNRVLCTSNPQAVGFLQQRVREYLAAHPEIEIFDFWPPDGAKWCTCPTCRELGSPSQRHALLVGQVADGLRRERPGVRVECIAYSSYVEPPARITFHPSVLVDFCPISQCFERQIDDPASEVNAGYARNLQAWLAAYKGDISIYSYYRKYAWTSLPIIIPHYMQKDLHFYRRAGVHGISSYAEPGDWFTYELNHYALGHLAWNPDADVDVVIGEFCKARYGPAAKVAEEVFASLEATTRKACGIPSTSLKTPAEYEAFAARIDGCVKAVDSAREANRDDAPLQAHLGRLGLMLQYAARNIALQRQVAARGDAAERQAMVDKLTAFLQQHAEDGVFVMRRVEPAGQYKRYGVTEPATRPARARRR